MNALTSVSKRNILALLLAFVASGANAEEIQPDADASQSVAGSDRSDVADTTQSVLSVDGDQMHADISDFFDRRWADRLLPAALTFGVMSPRAALTHDNLLRSDVGSLVAYKTGNWYCESPFNPNYYVVGVVSVRACDVANLDICLSSRG